MSKTFIYVLIVIAVYVLIIPKNSGNTKSGKNEAQTSDPKTSTEGKNDVNKDKRDKNGVLQGAQGRLNSMGITGGIGNLHTN